MKDSTDNEGPPILRVRYEVNTNSDIRWAATATRDCGVPLGNLATTNLACSPYNWIKLGGKILRRSYVVASTFAEGRHNLVLGPGGLARSANVPPVYCVYHKDGNVRNDRADNLAVCSPSEAAQLRQMHPLLV